MFNVSSDTTALIEKYTKNKKHMKLTVGLLSKGEKFVHVYGANGKRLEDVIYHYEIGSITKTFTTALLAKYVSDGIVSLDDSIDRYIELPLTGNYPSLRSLATHTSGYSALLPFTIGSYVETIFKVLNGTLAGNPLAGRIDETRLVEIIKTTKLKQKEYAYSYSNFGMSVLGYILGNISGKGYWQTMNDFIANELKLSNTRLGLLANNIHGYNRKDEDVGNWEWDRIEPFAAAGGLSSTVDDLLTYAELNMSQDNGYFELCHNNYAKGKRKFDMGLGWELHKGSNLIYKDGGAGALTSYVAFDKTKHIAAVVLANYTTPAIAKIGQSLLQDINC